MINDANTQLTLYSQLRELPFGWRNKIAKKCGVHYNTVYNTIVKGMSGQKSPEILAEAHAMIAAWKQRHVDAINAAVEAKFQEAEAAKLAYEEAKMEAEKLLNASATA